MKTLKIFKKIIFNYLIQKFLSLIYCYLCICLIGINDVYAQDKDTTATDSPKTTPSVIPEIPVQTPNTTPLTPEEPFRPSTPTQGILPTTPTPGIRPVGGIQTDSFATITDTTVLPIELSSFSAKVDRNNVLIIWTTAWELNNSGFEIERKLITSVEWLKLADIKGGGTTSEPVSYSYTDESISKGKYNYRLKQIDYNGNFQYFTLSTEVSVGIPDKYSISQNYPNPFNPVTKIDYDLPHDSKVRIVLFDILGREVARLVNEVKESGYYTIDFDARNLSSGAYFYRINAERNGKSAFEVTKKMMVVK